MSPERPGAAVGEGHIGLASCRERIEIAGGTLQLHSEPGEGTRVSLTLPFEPREERIPPPAPALTPELDPEYAGIA